MGVVGGGGVEQPLNVMRGFAAKAHKKYNTSKFIKVLFISKTRKHLQMSIGAR